MAFAQRVRLNAAKSGVRSGDITTMLGYLTPDGLADKLRGTNGKAQAALRKFCIGMFVFYCALLLAVCVAALASANTGRSEPGGLSVSFGRLIKNGLESARPAPTIPAGVARRRTVKFFAHSSTARR
jgi:hypothetical protein